MTTTCTEIAESFELWGAYIDPDGTLTEAEFSARTIHWKVALIHDMFPDDCHCKSKEEEL